MNVPITCPICGDSLVNDSIMGSFIYYKNCRLRPTHIFSCVIYGTAGGDERVERIVFTLSMEPMLSVKFYLYGKTMQVGKCSPTEHASLDESADLPFYVEPDFSDHQKLVNKIKTYILFS